MWNINTVLGSQQAFSVTYIQNSAELNVKFISEIEKMRYREWPRTSKCPHNFHREMLPNTDLSFECTKQKNHGWGLTTKTMIVEYMYMKKPPP